MISMHVVQDANWIAVLVAALSSFIIGGLWYSPLLLGKTWLNASGLTEADLQKGNPAVTYGVSLILCIVIALGLSAFVAAGAGWKVGLHHGVTFSLVFVAASFGVNYLFEKKSLKLFIVNAGYHVVQFAVIGIVLGVWPI